MMEPGEREDELLRSVALKNASSILRVRQRAEQELLEAKEALHRSDQFNRSIIESSRDCLKTLTLDGVLVWISDSGCRALRIDDPAEVLGKSYLDFWEGDAREAASAAVESAAKGGSGSFVGFFPIRGDPRWWEVVITPIRDSTGNPERLLAVSRDVTERIESERRLRESEHQLRLLLESEQHARSSAERANRMKDEFLATLSHELRTPLSAILGWTHLLRSRDCSPEDLRKGLDTIERNARVQTHLIEDLLDMSRIISGKVRMDVQPVFPAQSVETALETVRPAAEAKGVRLESVLDPLAGPISGDSSRLQQIIWNLLNNAIKFTPRGGKILVALGRVDSHIEISVADTGAGIHPQLLQHVFERFRQADSSSTRQFGGLGLGLAIVKNLVELHGGTVHATSEGLGKGATFALHLPLAALSRVPQPERQDPTQLAAFVAMPEVDLSGLRVLIVDDQADARELIARVLSDCQAQVTTAGSALDAMIMLQQERPHVIVSDIGMPDIDGFELLRRVRALGKTGGGRIPAIALTAFARSEDRTRALREGFQAHVSKPVEAAELIATVASVTGRSDDPTA